MKRPMVTMALIALAVATLLDTDDAVAAAQQIRYAPVRVPVVDALQPVDVVAGALRLDAPAHALARAAGNPPTSSTDGDPRGLAARARALAAQLPAEAPRPSVRPSASHGPAPVPYMTDGPPGDPLPDTSGGRPLRVLITGDSTAGEPGYALSDLLAAAGRADVDVRDEPFTGTGLTRPDAFDWAQMATQQSRAYQPDVVVVFLGENDGYPLGGASPYGAAWADQYADRVVAVIDAYRSGGARQVIWAAPPIDAQTSPWEGSNVNGVFQNIGTAIRRPVASVPGTAMLDQYPLFSVDGRFSHPVPDPTTGAVVDARAADGSHLTRAGGAIVARLLLRHLDRDRQPQSPPSARADPSPLPASAAPVSGQLAGRLAGGRLLSHSSPVPARRSTAPYTWSVIAFLVLLRIFRRRLAARMRTVRAGLGTALADAVLTAPARLDEARAGLAAAGRGAVRAVAAGRGLALAAVERRVATGRVPLVGRPRGRRRSGLAPMPPGALMSPGALMPPGTPMFPATRTPPLAHSATRPHSPPPLPSVPAVFVTVRPGTFCAVEGSWGRDADGRLLRCTRTPGGQRLRWRLPAEPVELSPVQLSPVEPSPVELSPVESSPSVTSDRP